MPLCAQSVKESDMQRSLQAVAMVALSTWLGLAQAAPLTLTKLTGVTGGALAATAVFQADLGAAGLGTFQSISIVDNSSGLGGAAGQFSGFDLDAIIISDQNCATAACVAGLTGLSVFDFGAGTLFTPGVQRVPTDPKLYGTDASGMAVDNSVATLGVFDGESSTVTPFGFLSLGDDGILSFNLTSSLSTAGLFLYVGEVGDNGEALAGSFTISDQPVGVPEPGALPLVFAALGAAAFARRRAKA
jgi:hypothetical protein